MAEAHLDHPGEISWYAGQGPAPVLGPCPHSDCPHDFQSCIAHGPDFRRYTLDQCDVADGCNGTCRSWHDPRMRATTAWLHIDRQTEQAAR